MKKNPFELSSSSSSESLTSLSSEEVEDNLDSNSDELYGEDSDEGTRKLK